MKLKFNSTARIQLAGAAMLLLGVLFVSDFYYYGHYNSETYYVDHQYMLRTSDSYYIFVRIAMAVIGAYLAYDYYRRERKELAVTFAVIAAVSPSQLKIEFDPDFMTIVDVLVSVLLLILAMKEAGFSLKEWKNKHDIQINFKTMTEKQNDNREERGTSSILQDAADNNSSAQYRGYAYAEKVEPSKGQPPFFSSLFSFKGRNTRSRYWLVWGLFCLGLLLGLTFDKGSGRYGVFVNRFLDIVLVILGICSYWIELANNVKRLHDLGHSGWNVLWLLVPIICFVYCIYTAFWKGEMHDNKYGPNPYE